MQQKEKDGEKKYRSLPCLGMTWSQYAWRQAWSNSINHGKEGKIEAVG